MFWKSHRLKNVQPVIITCLWLVAAHNHCKTLIHNHELGDSTDAARDVVNEIKQLGGNAMAIHASVEEADAIVDQIMGTVIYLFEIYI